MSDCPKCGYPTLGCYKGLYTPGQACPGCGFVDHLKNYLDQVFNERVKGPTKVPMLLDFGSAYLRDMADNPSMVSGDMLRRCARIMEAAAGGLRK